MRKIRTLTILLLLILGSVIMVLPYWCMTTLSFELPEETVAVPPHLVPEHPTISNFIRLFKELNFERYILNSIIITVSIVLSQIILCSMAGYAFARFYFPFKNVLFFLFLLVFLLAGVTLLIPRYILAKNLGLIDTLGGIIFFEILSVFGIFLYRQHILGIPADFEEAAIIDGASIWRLYWGIIMPLSKAISIAFAILVLIYAWNLFLWPLILLSSSNKFPLSVALALLEGQYFGEWGTISAGAFIATLPPIVIWIILQKRINLAAVFIGEK